MADWFVSATGTGSGLTAATACSCLRVITRSAMAYGDTVWVSRNMVMDIGGSGSDRRNWPRGDGNSLDSNSHQLIVGWPSPGDPYYEVRPTEAVSEGWDTHSPAVAGINYPVWVGSSSAGGDNSFWFDGSLSVPKNIIANFCYANSSGGLGSISYYFFKNVHNRRMNIHLLNCRMEEEWSNVTDVTMTLSAWNGVDGVLDEGTGLRKLTITASSVIDRLFSRNRTYEVQEVDHVHILSSSVAWLFSGDNAVNERADKILYIRRITGVKPWEGLGPTNHFSTSDDIAHHFAIDDYYGEGPYLPDGRNGLPWRVNSAVRYNGVDAVYADITSGANGYGANGQWVYRRPPVEAYINVTSGTPFTLKWPVRVASRHIWGYHVEVNIKSPGIRVTEASTAHWQAGSLNAWTGSFNNVGSAYVFTNTYTPQETGLVPVNIRVVDLGVANKGGGQICLAPFPEIV